MTDKNYNDIVSDFLEGRTASREAFEAEIAEYAAEQRRQDSEREGRRPAPITRDQRGLRFQSRSRAHKAAWIKTDGHCFYCGAEDATHLEHQMPRYRGGKTTAQNCVVSCGSCNARKHTKTAGEFRIFLMIAFGRAPTPFFGEEPGPQRDWLIVTGNSIRRRYGSLMPKAQVRASRSAAMHRRMDAAGEHLERIGAYLGESPGKAPA